MTEIEGVIIKKLNPHIDQRGVFSEILRVSDEIFRDEFGQISFSISNYGVTKAWHLHKKQTDWMIVLIGDVKLVLFDTRDNSVTKGNLIEILMGETFGKQVVRVPPGVAHGYKVLNGPMHMLYIMNYEYDPSDELRLPHDDISIGYDWISPIPIT